jgi:hypothetical protein
LQKWSAFRIAASEALAKALGDNPFAKADY